MMSPFSTLAPSDRAVAEALSRGWWLLLVWGIVSIVAGIAVLGFDWTAQSLAFFVGACFVVAGIFRAASAAPDRDSRRWSVAVGAVQALAGIAILAWPEPGLLVIAVFIAAYLVVGGVVNIVGGLGARGAAGWWLVLIMGILELLLGLVALVQPTFSLAILIAVIGVWLVLVGMIQCVLAFEVRTGGPRVGPPPAPAT